MRLIDADRLKVVLEKNFGHTGGASVLEQLIDEQPTIDPVKHGRWIEDGYGNGEIVCSNCGEPCATFSMLKPRDRYCKWCGAKMEGEEDETD